MKAISMVRSAVGMLLAVLLLAGAEPRADLALSGVRAQATASPLSPDVEASTPEEMLGRLLDRLLGLDGAMVTYADVALQIALLSITPPRDAGDLEGLQQWMTAVMPINGGVNGW